MTDDEHAFCDPDTPVSFIGFEIARINSTPVAHLGAIFMFDLIGSADPISASEYQRDAIFLEDFLHTNKKAHKNTLVRFWSSNST